MKYSPVFRALAGIGAFGALIAALIGAVVILSRPEPPPRMTRDRVGDDIEEAYSGRVSISAEDKPINDARAWIATLGKTHQWTVQELKVDGNEIVLPEFKSPKPLAATLYVFSHSYGLGFEGLWPAHEKRTQIILRRPVSGGGKLLLPNGQPAANVAIRCVRFLGEGAWGVRSEDGPPPGLNLPIFRTVTDKDGNFLFSKLADTTAYTLDVEDTRYAELRSEMRLDERNPYEPLKIQLYLASTLSGRVSRNGKPVPGIEVQAKKPTFGFMPFKAKTDHDGRYVMSRVPMGNYLVNADLDVAMQREVVSVTRPSVKVVEGQPTSGVDFALVPGAILEGHIVDGKAKPASGLQVSVQDTDELYRSYSTIEPATDRAGTFKVRFSPGTYNLTIRAPGVEAKAKVKMTDGVITKLSLTQGVLPTKPAPKILDRPFYGPAQLKGGGTVSLIWVRSDDGPPEFWAPDGRVIHPEEGKRGIVGTSGMLPNKMTRKLIAAVKVESGTAEPCSYQIKLPFKAESGFTSIDSADDKSHLGFGAFEVPPARKFAHLKFGVAAGPFRSVASGKWGAGLLHAEQVTKGSGKEPLPVPVLRPNTVTIRVRIPAEWEGKDLTLAAYDKQGKAHIAEARLTESNTENAAHIPCRTYTFLIANASMIDHLELKAREFDWVEFRYVQLFPKSK